ncbi:hypothetical protein RRG08_058478 [Elysia crispata]|uniref:Uncharacterized protein n=1 Tax=Elysia crispata TaxID=231223 RepID=A0AAE0Y6K5_9GAST|nr:hypothetical protein RRG08_058478 [Elysia crispata]
MQPGAPSSTANPGHLFDAASSGPVRARLNNHPQVYDQHQTHRLTGSRLQSSGVKYIVENGATYPGTISAPHCIDMLSERLTWGQALSFPVRGEEQGL